MSLSTSRRTVTVTTTSTSDGKVVEASETLKLPGQVAPAARNVIRDVDKQRAQIVRVGDDIVRREYSFRMPLDPLAAGNLSTEDSVIDDFVPWTAADMDPFTRMKCRKCGNEIFGNSSSSSSGWTWKDLPSGNWAEMMDFWHCHKPDPHDDDDNGNSKTADAQNARVQGYGAANRVVAMPSTVLVDVSSFLICEDECKGLIKVMLSSLFVISLKKTFIHWAKKRSGQFAALLDLDLDTIAPYQFCLKSASWNDETEMNRYPPSDGSDGFRSSLHHTPRLSMEWSLADIFPLMLSIPRGMVLT